MQSIRRSNDSGRREVASRESYAIVMTGLAARALMSVKTGAWHVAGAGVRMPAWVEDPRSSDREKGKRRGFDGESRPSVASRRASTRNSAVILVP